MTLERFFRDVKLAEKRGIVKTTISAEGRDCIEITRIGWLWRQYQRVLEGQYVDPKILPELRYFKKLNCID